MPDTQRTSRAEAANTADHHVPIDASKLATDYLAALDMLKSILPYAHSYLMTTWAEEEYKRHEAIVAKAAEFLAATEGEMP